MVETSKYDEIAEIYRRGSAPDIRNNHVEVVSKPVPSDDDEFVKIQDEEGFRSTAKWKLNASRTCLVN